MLIKKSMKVKDCPHRTKALLCFFPEKAEKGKINRASCPLYGRVPIERCLKLFPKPRVAPKEFTTGKCLRCGKLLGSNSSSSGLCSECLEEGMMEMESTEREEGVEDDKTT